MTLLFRGAAAALILCSPAAVAQDKPESGDTATALSVVAMGCPETGVEQGCLMLKWKGRTWNITAADPKPELGRSISLHGTATPGMSSCNQGIVVKDITWKYTQQKCPR